MRISRKSASAVFQSPALPVARMAAVKAFTLGLHIGSSCSWSHLKICSAALGLRFRPAMLIAVVATKTFGACLLGLRVKG